MNKILTGLCFLSATILYSIDQICLAIFYHIVSRVNMSVFLGYYHNIITILLALFFLLLGIYFLFEEKLIKFYHSKRNQNKEHQNN